jgi:hypothetical protein
MRKIPTTFTLDQPTIDWLRAEAERRDVTMSKVVRQILAREMSAPPVQPKAPVE